MPEEDQPEDYNLLQEILHKKQKSIKSSKKQSSSKLHKTSQLKQTSKNYNNILPLYKESKLGTKNMNNEYSTYNKLAQSAKYEQINLNGELNRE